MTWKPNKIQQVPMFLIRVTRFKNNRNLNYDTYDNNLIVSTEIQINAINLFWNHNLSESLRSKLIIIHNFFLSVLMFKHRRHVKQPRKIYVFFFSLFMSFNLGHWYFPVFSKSFYHTLVVSIIAISLLIGSSNRVIWGLVLYSF